MLDGGQAMGDDQRGAALRQLGQRALDGHFGGGIERRGGFVEDEDRRVLEEDAGDGDALLLSARELDAALAYHRIEPVGQARNHLVETGAPRRFHHRLVTGPELTIGDILANGAAEQEHILLHDADLAAQGRLRHVPDVDAIDRDRAAVELVEARQERAERGLAGAGGTNDSHGLAGLDGQAHPVEHLAAVLIAEADVVEDDIALEVIHHPCARPVGDIGLGINQIGEAAEAGDALGIAFQHAGDLVDGAHEDIDQQQEADEAAIAQLAVDHEPGAHQHDDELHQARAQIGDGDAGRHIGIGLQLGLAIGVVVAGEQARFVRFIGEGLDHADAADGVLDARVEVADLTEQSAPVLRHAGAIAADQPGHHRHDQRGDQRQLPVDREHQDERANEGHDGDEEVFGPVVGYLADVFEVLGHMGDEVPGLVIVEEAEAELLQMVEHLPAHIGLDADAQHVAEIIHHAHQHGIEHIDRQQRRSGDQDEAEFRARQQLVDEIGDRHGKGELEQAGDDGTAEIEHEQTLVGGVIGKEALDHEIVLNHAGSGLAVAGGDRHGESHIKWIDSIIFSGGTDRGQARSCHALQKHLPVGEGWKA